MDVYQTPTLTHTPLVRVFVTGSRTCFLQAPTHRTGDRSSTFSGLFLPIISSLYLLCTSNGRLPSAAVGSVPGAASPSAPTRGGACWGSCLCSSLHGCSPASYPHWHHRHHDRCTRCRSPHHSWLVPLGPRRVGGRRMVNRRLVGWWLACSMKRSSSVWGWAVRMRTARGIEQSSRECDDDMESRARRAHVGVVTDNGSSG